MAEIEGSAARAVRLHREEIASEINGFAMRNYMPSKIGYPCYWMIRYRAHLVESKKIEQGAFDGRYMHM